MKLQSSEFNKQWTINNFPLFYVDLLFFGDTEKRKKLLGHEYGGHVLASVHRVVTFYQNKKTVAKTIPIGKEKYLDKAYIEYFISLTHEIEKSLHAVVEKINNITANTTLSELADVFDQFVHRYAELLAIYRFTRPDMYESAIDELQKQIPGLQDHHLVCLLEGKHDELPYGVTDSHKTHFHLLQKIGTRRLELHQVYASQFERAKTLLNALAHYMGLPLSLVEHCTSQEIFKFLHNGEVPDDAILKEREKAYVYCYTEQDAQIIYETLEFVDHKETGKEVGGLQGVTAFPGNVSGRVCLITHNIGKTQSEEMQAMQRGDVLVTVSTSPDMMPAIRKAGAIVVEEGGILSHAAIISRELKIPCIMKVTDVTRKLKSGDMVQVNADKGMVRKTTYTV